MATIVKRPNGNYQVQIRADGFRVTRTFSKKSLAKQFAQQVETDTELSRKLGKSVTPSPTFNELVDMYMAQYTGRDPSTVGRLDFWSKRFGTSFVTSLTEEDIDDGVIHLEKTPFNIESKQQLKDKFKPRYRTGSTINRYKSTLSGVFIYFIKHPDYKKLVRDTKFKNPVRGDTVSSFSENPSKDRFLTQDEQTKLLAACKSSNWGRLYALVLLALTTGARKGELLGLKWADIDLQNRTAALGTEILADGRYSTKNGKRRYLPLTQPMVDELKRLRDLELSEMKGTDDLKKHRLLGTYCVFPSTVDKTKAFDIKKAWLKALSVSKIGHARFHDLRHTSASNLVKTGRSLFEVGQLLGHSSTTMTARYSHLAIGDTMSMVDDVMGHLK